MVCLLCSPSQPPGRPTEGRWITERREITGQAPGDEQASGWARAGGARPRSASLWGEVGEGGGKRKRSPSGTQGLPARGPKGHVSLTPLLSFWTVSAWRDLGGG